MEVPLGWHENRTRAEKSAVLAAEPDMDTSGERRADRQSDEDGKEPLPRHRPPTTKCVRDDHGHNEAPAQQAEHQQESSSEKQRHQSRRLPDQFVQGLHPITDAGSHGRGCAQALVKAHKVVVR